MCFWCCDEWSYVTCIYDHLNRVFLSLFQSVSIMTSDSCLLKFVDNIISSPASKPPLPLKIPIGKRKQLIVDCWEHIYWYDKANKCVPNSRRLVCSSSWFFDSCSSCYIYTRRWSIGESIIQLKVKPDQINWYHQFKLRPLPYSDRYFDSCHSELDGFCLEKYIKIPTSQYYHQSLFSCLRSNDFLRKRIISTMFNLK